MLMSWFRRHTPEEPPPAPKRQGLNAYQQRALNSTLVHLERQVLTLERLVRGEHQGTLIHPTKPFSSDARQRLLELFDHLHQEIGATAAAFALPGVEENIPATVGGTCAILWSNLEDVRPAMLNRYGAVDPTLEEALGPHIERLIQSVLALEQIAQAERQRPQQEAG
jgi:hypothetical protein